MLAVGSIETSSSSGGFARQELKDANTPTDMGVDAGHSDAVVTGEDVGIWVALDVTGNSV